MKLKDLSSAPKGALVFLNLTILILSLVSCSHQSLSLFFDLPPPDPETEQTQDSAEALRKEASAQRGPWSDLSQAYSGLERPPIEDVLTWEEAQEILPKDYKNQPDWSAAIKLGLIRPRSGPDPSSRYAAIFKYDFIIKAEKPKNEAYFPHSAHTQWLGCKNCHASLYPYKRNPATMKEMRAGASCGACHGKVAFSLRQCKRCHLQR